MVHVVEENFNSEKKIRFTPKIDTCVNGDDPVVDRIDIVRD